MLAPVRCCFDVMFLLFSSLFALSVHQALGSSKLRFLFFLFIFAINSIVFVTVSTSYYT